MARTNETYTVEISHRASCPGYWWCAPHGWTPADPGLIDNADADLLGEGSVYAYDQEDEDAVAEMAVYAPDAEVPDNLDADDVWLLEVGLEDLRWLQSGTCDLASLAEVKAQR
jgi:hypothetical protein